MIHIFFGERAASKINDVPKETPKMDINKAGIIGSGTMGGGIAMCFANIGIPVHIVDQDEENLKKGLAAIERNYKFMVDTIGNADSSLAEDVRIQNYGQDVSDEEHEMANDEVRELFNQYVEKLTEGGRQPKLVEEDKELSDEELDTLPCSDTKH